MASLFRSTLRDRWQLIIGDCKHELPQLLAELRQTDLFHHDSLHTYDHMMWSTSNGAAVSTSERHTRHMMCVPS